MGGFTGASCSCAGRPPLTTKVSAEKRSEVIPLRVAQVHARRIPALPQGYKVLHGCNLPRGRKHPAPRADRAGAVPYIG